VDDDGVTFTVVDRYRRLAGLRLVQEIGLDDVSFTRKRTVWTLHVVRPPEAKRGFVLLPRRWVVERSFAWATRCRRLVKDYERYATTLASFHVIAFVGYMLKHAAELMQSA